MILSFFGEKLMKYINLMQTFLLIAIFLRKQIFFNKIFSFSLRSEAESYSRQKRKKQETNKQIKNVYFSKENSRKRRRNKNIFDAQSDWMIVIFF